MCGKLDSLEQREVFESAEGEPDLVPVPDAVFSAPDVVVVKYQ